jgi:ribose transport system ATP-binding protein
MSLVEMRGIGKRFGGTVALDNVDVFFEVGEVHALLGENGSGKSTLMRVLAGGTAPDEGEMRLNGSRFAPPDPFEARKRGIAMIYQELTLCPDLTVAENIALGMEERVVNRERAGERARDALRQLGHSHLDPHALVRDLPLSARQIVEIARAIVNGSQVLIFDEPTSSLSEPDVQQLFRMIRTLKEQGVAVIYISHFLNEIEEIADRVSVLRDGKLITTRLAGELDQNAMVALMVGRTIEDAYPRTHHPTNDLLLSVVGLSGLNGPEEASIEVHRGEVIGVAGLNGSGRTELLRCIFGLDAVKRGDVTVGQFSGWTNPCERWRQGVGMLSEDRKQVGLALDLSIAANLTLTRLPPVVSGRDQREACAELIERAGIKCRNPEQPVGELSGGNQQKVAFARLLYHDVDLLLLDEPTRGIDVGSKQQLYLLIDDLARQGKAVLMVSSYLPELLGVCDRIAVMHRGRLGRPMSVGEWDQESLMRAATGA